MYGEAWSKDWPNRIKKDITAEEYNKNFNWVTSWAHSHFIVITEKLLPIFIFIILNILFLFFTKCLRKNIYDKNIKFLYFLFLINFLSSILWFIKFPIYRYGLSFIYIMMITLLYFIYIKYIDFKRLEKFYNIFTIFIFVLSIGVIGKNINRVLNSYPKTIYPLMFDAKSPTKSIRVLNKEKIFTHYTIKNGNSCGYSISPCSSFDLSVRKKIIFGYKIFYNY